MKRGRPGAGAARHGAPASSPRPPRPDAALSRRGALAVAAVLAITWGVLFAPQIAGRVFVLGDSAAYRPYAELSRTRWAHEHDRTLWNPYVFFGIPSAASLADPRPQWLPGPLLTLADAAAPVTDRWRVPLALLAGALCMAALARSLWRCGAEACALAGAGWLLAPALIVPLAFGHEAEVWTLALWPAVALAARAALVADRRKAAIGAGLALAGVLAMQVLGAHPQFFAYGLLAAAVLSLPLVRGATAFARTVVAAAGALALAMSAAAWLPAWLYAAESVRQLPQLMRAESLTFSAGGRDLLSAVWPHAAGFGDASYWGAMRATDYPHFVGAALAALALFGAIATRARSRAAAAGLAALAVFALLAALGPRTPLGSLLLALPVTGSFRTPVTWLTLAQFSAALLAARGVHAASEGRGRALAGLGLALAVAGVALLATGAGANAYADAMTAARAATAGADWPARAAAEAPLAMRDLGLRLLLTGAALALAFARGSLPDSLRGAATVAAAFCAALDLATVALPLGRHAIGSPSALAPPAATDSTRLIAADPRHRALALSKDTFYSNAWIAWRARSVSGLHGAVPRRWQDIRYLLLSGAAGFRRDAAVRWLLPPEDVALQPPSDLAGGWRVSTVPGLWEYPAALPRAHAVPRVVVLPGDPAVLASLADSAFAPESVALTTESGAAGDYADPAGVAIAWREDAPDRVTLAVTAPANAFIVLSDAWLPGWAAMLDGRPVQVHRVDHVFRGVNVPAGAHEVRFAYVPPGWNAGVLASRVAWLLFVAALAWWAITMRSRRAPRPA